MDGSSLKAIEFYGFMALAAWLVYSQLVASRRDRDRPDEPPPDDASGEDDRSHR
jgi:hypothetical protein